MTGKGGGGGRGFKGGGGNKGGLSQQQHQNARDKREEIKNFLGFYKRTDSVCIDLYQPEFFRRKPTWEEMALFVSQQLCLTPQLRAALKDIQLHPVKKHLFIKFRDTNSRDVVAGKLKTGVDWPAFEANVHGWAMDKPVIVVRLHGVSPESTKQDIQNVMDQYGEVLDVEIGFISKKLLPGVTNGTWTIKMILTEGKILPSFVFMKEEGEVWQVIHENQVNVCWKCGQSGHVGARCNQPTLTFDALDVSQAVAEGDGVGAGGARSWAHVVKSGAQPGAQASGSISHDLNELQLQEELYKKLKEDRIRTEELASKEKAEADIAKQASNKEEADRVAKEAAQEFVNKEILVKIAMEQTVSGGVVEPTNEEVENFSSQAGTNLIEKDDLIQDKAIGDEFITPVNVTVPSVSNPTKRKSRSRNKDNKKSKFNQKESSHSDAEMHSGTDTSVIDLVEEKSLSMVPDSRVTDSDQTYNSQDTSKAGSLDSQATSKAGLTPDSDLFNISGKQLQVIVPDASSDSSTNSSLEGQAEKQEFSDLPFNERSIQNRDLKAFLVAKK